MLSQGQGQCLHHEVEENQDSRVVPLLLPKTLPKGAVLLLNLLTQVVIISTPELLGVHRIPVVPRLNHSYRIYHPFVRQLDARRVVVKAQVLKLVRLVVRVVPHEVIVWARVAVAVQRLKVSRPTGIGGVRAVLNVEIVARRLSVREVVVTTVESQVRKDTSSSATTTNE